MSNLKLIAIHGAPRAGKDTLAKYLCETHGFFRIGFADAVYDKLSRVFDISPDHLKDEGWKETPLNVLSVYNVADPEYRRFLFHYKKQDLYEPRTSRYHARMYAQEYMAHTLGEHNTVWADIAVKKAEDALEKGRQVVFSDLRQPKELRKVREMAAQRRIGSKIVRIVREGVQESSYVSESPLPLYEMDVTIYNRHNDLLGLFSQADTIVGT